MRMLLRSSSFAAFTTLSMAAVSAAQTLPDAAMFSRDRILDVRIVMTPADWRDVRFSQPAADTSAQSTEPGYLKKPGDLWIDGTRVGRVGVRKKGTFGSVVSTRPSLKLALDEYERDLSYRGVTDLTLNNNVQDRTLAHQLLAADFFQRAGVPSSRANLAHVWVNDEDMGVYTHVEAIDRPFLRRVFGADRGALYEAEVGDFTAERLSGISEKRAVRPEDQRRLQRVTELLAAPGPVSLADLGALIDLDAFIRFWAAESLIGHWDGYAGNRNNTYLYVHPADGKLRFIPSGADSVFIDPSGPSAALNPPKLLKAIGQLCLRLWELPEIRTRYVAVMRELLAGPWDEQRTLAELSTIQRSAVPVSGLPLDIVETATERVRQFVSRRRSEVMAELSGPLPDWPTAAVIPNLPYTLTASFTAPWGRTAPGAPTATGAAQLTLAVQGQGAVTFDRAGAYAITNEMPSPRATYPGVIITGVSGTRTWRITMSIDPTLLGVTTVPIDQFKARAQLTIIDEGRPARNRNIQNFGELRLEEASASEGGVLRGTFTLRGVTP